MSDSRLFPSDDWHLVPSHLLRGLDGHIASGTETGEFLAAVLANDLRQAVLRADEQSLAGLRGLLQFLYCDAPSPCWGSVEARDAWRARGGLAGRPA